MAELTPPVFLQAGGESAQTSRLAIGAAILASGVVNPADLIVSAPGGTMTVAAAAGQGWVVGSRASQGGYHIVNDAPKTVTIAASDPTNPRFDRVVAQINDAAFLGVVNSFVIAVITGTASSSPVEPTIPADSFELARITVGAAVTTIAAGNILDRRVRAVQRGVMFSAAATGDASLATKLIAGQTGNGFEVQDATGFRIFSVGPDGTFGFPGHFLVSPANVVQVVQTAGGDPATQASVGQLYVIAGALKFRGGSGTITVVAPA